MEDKAGSAKLGRNQRAKRKKYFREDWEDKASHGLPDSTAAEPKPLRVIFLGEEASGKTAYQASPFPL